MAIATNARPINVNAATSSNPPAALPRGLSASNRWWLRQCSPTTLWSLRRCSRRDLAGEEPTNRVPRRQHHGANSDVHGKLPKLVLLPFGGQNPDARTLPSGARPLLHCAQFIDETGRSPRKSGHFVTETSLAALRLTPEEIEALLRGARETSEWAKTIYPGLRIAQQIYSPERYQ